MNGRLNRNGTATWDRNAPVSDFLSRIQKEKRRRWGKEREREMMDDVIVLGDDEPAKTPAKKEKKVETKKRSKKQPLYDDQADVKAHERRMLRAVSSQIEMDLLVIGAVKRFKKENAREREIARRDVVENTTDSTINTKPLSSWSNDYGAMRARREVPPPPPRRKARTRRGGR